MSSESISLNAFLELFSRELFGAELFGAERLGSEPTRKRFDALDEGAAVVLFKRGPGAEALCVDDTIDEEGAVQVVAFMLVGTRT